MNKTQQKNFEALKTVYPVLYERVLLSPPEIPDPSPIEEESQLPELNLPGLNQADVIVLCGFSTPRYAEEIVKMTTETTCVIIVEISLGLFIRTISRYPLHHIILNSSVRLIIDSPDPSAIRRTLEEYFGFLSFSAVEVLKDPLSCRLDPGYYEKIEEAIGDLKSVSGLNRRTMDFFLEEWNRHILQNLRHIMSCHGIKKLFGRFRGVPAVVVSAGPSLDKNIRWLKYISPRALVISVDSAYRTLRDHDIKVHFVLCIDSQEKNFSHMEGVAPGETTLVINPVTYPAMPDSFGGNILLMTCNIPLMNWIEEQTGELGETLVGGSVSTSSFDFARKLGCNPVILSGQDLCYESNRGYVSGSLYSAIFEKAIRHNNSMGSLHSDYISLNSTRNAGNIFGASVPSNDEMLSWKNWYETVAGSGSTINSTEGGLNIDGFLVQPLHETAFSALINTGEFVEIGELIRECLSEKEAPDRSELLSSLHLYRGALQAVTDLAGEGLRYSSEFSRSFSEEVSGGKHITRFNRLHDLCLSVLAEKIFIDTNQWEISNLLDRLAQNESGESEANLKEKLESYKLLFKGVVEISKRTRGNLDDGLKKLQTLES